MELDSTSTKTDGSSSIRGAGNGGHAHPGHAPVMVLASALIAAVGTYAGINLFVPSVAGLGMAWFASRILKPRDPLIVPAFAVLFGHLAWMLAGALLAGFQDVWLDLTTMTGLLLWLWWRPGLWSSVGVFALSLLGLAWAVNDLQLQAWGDPTHRALVTHAALRVLVIALLAEAAWRRRAAVRASTQAIQH